MSAQRIAVCPGSFDPITLGHEDIIRRSLRFADRVIVGVAYSATHVKNGMFDVDERVQMIRETFADEPAVTAVSVQGLLVEFATAQGAAMIVRGLRAVSDFEYEFQMALMNRHLSPQLETVFMIPSLDTTYISASLVREVARFGGKVDDLVHPSVAAALRAKLGQA